jgi:hypothetical protein
VRWTKLGRIVPTPPPVPWAVSHAMVPFVEPTDGAVRIYFSGRDDAGRSITGSAEFDPARPETVEYGPALLGPGRLGAFDDSGAMGSCLVSHGGRRHLYYIGWSRGVSVPFYTFIGCAVSTGGEFERLSEAPVVERSPQDPYLATSPWALFEDGRWRLWYASGVRWEARDEGPRHFYNIRYADSEDGISWHRDGRVCIDFAEGEYALARPCVVRHDDRYRMWYSRRGDAYRIGYAESPDGLEWERKDGETGIDVSHDGWDSEMIEYPCVFQHDGGWFMLYNGNGYGATGIGLAVLEDD